MGKGKKETVTIHSIEQTKKLAQKIAKSLHGNEVIALEGELGSGKTHFVKFLAEALGVDPQDVISPTYIYWREYQGDKFAIDHFDMYRIESSADVSSIGLEEVLSQGESVVLIEWADKIRTMIPKDALWISIENLGEEKRVFSISR